MKHVNSTLVYSMYTYTTTTVLLSLLTVWHGDSLLIYGSTAAKFAKKRAIKVNITLIPQWILHSKPCPLAEKTFLRIFSPTVRVTSDFESKGWKKKQMEVWK